MPPKTAPAHLPAPPIATQREHVVPILSPVLVSGAGRRGGERDQFAAEELAVVLSHYDTGVIHGVHPFPRGSRWAPKLLIRADHGAFLLKRRARGKDNPYKVAFSHDIQMHLAGKRFPLPQLIGTRRDNNSMLQWQGRIYELFEFVQGSPYDHSAEATADAGKTLALFHALLGGYRPQYDPPRGTYHDAPTVNASMGQIPRMLIKVDPHNAREQAGRIEETVAFLCAAYEHAAGEVNTLGMGRWPTQVVHCDWHPGNMLFRDQAVVAVVDYDAARIQQRVLDVANAGLQFSMLAAGDDAGQWPAETDLGRLGAFIRGYESVPDCLLAKAELQALPWLMIEALIAESAIPIAATGSFARIDGVGFLMMIERKVGWLQRHAAEVQRVAGEE